MITDKKDIKDAHLLSTLVQATVHAREPLNSNSAVIAWWLQSTSAQNFDLTVKKGNILVNFLLLKIFLAN